MVCKQPFKDGDDIVVCPQCGAPYHRSCYSSVGHCVMQDKHGEYVWQSPKADRQETAYIICPSCGAQNPPNAHVCRSCHADFENTRDRVDRYAFELKDPVPFEEEEAGKSEWDLAGISTKELSAYVGPNSLYFINQFRQLMDSKFNISWNWAAFFFSFWYFLYRKMYNVGLALLGLYAAAVAANTVVLLSTPQMQELFNGTLAFDQGFTSVMSVISTVLSSAQFVASLLCGAMANGAYLKKTVVDIKYIQQQHADRESRDYYSALYYAGKPNVVIVVVLAVVYILLMSTLTSMLMSSAGLL